MRNFTTVFYQGLIQNRLMFLNIFQKTKIPPKSLPWFWSWSILREGGFTPHLLQFACNHGGVCVGPSATVQCPWGSFLKRKRAHREEESDSFQGMGERPKEEDRVGSLQAKIGMCPRPFPRKRNPIVQMPPNLSSEFHLLERMPDLRIHKWAYVRTLNFILLPDRRPLKTWGGGVDYKIQHILKFLGG